MLMPSLDVSCRVKFSSSRSQDIQVAENFTALQVGVRTFIRVRYVVLCHKHDKLAQLFKSASLL